MPSSPRVLNQCPAPSEKRVALRVTPDAERMLAKGHPWVYDQAIRRQSHEGRAGDLAVVFDRHNRFLAIGLYDPTSPIRVRVLQARRPAPIDAAWYEARLSAALKLRAGLARLTNGFRLVHGENDGLPGLVIDRYDTTLVIKLYTPAWIPHLRPLAGAIERAYAPKRVVLRLGRAAQEDPGLLGGLRNGLVLSGPPLSSPLRLQEHGLQFEVDPVRGQKTGFFLDQRDNRAAVGRLCRGMAVLDVFAYTGAFSVHAARGGARAVLSLDGSRAALEAAVRNMALNRRHRAVAEAAHETMAGEAFEALAALKHRRRRFDVVILDPPSFAASRREVPAAMTSYARLTALGLSVLSSGGVLVQACCSGQVGEADFFAMVYRAAAKAGWRLTDLARTGHPVDHPVTFREGAYLKCLMASAAMRKLQ